MTIFLIKNSIVYLATAVCFLFFVESSNAATNEDNYHQKVESTASQTQVVTVSYVTLRDKNKSSTSLEKYYGGERDELRAGTCEVTFSPIKGLQGIAGASPFYIPSQKAALTGLTELPIDSFLETINISSGSNTVVYIHGYNIDFWKSCRRTSMFQRSLGLADRLILFSWPAAGNVLKYTWDESDLYWSVAYIAQFLEELITQKGQGKVDLVVHSLGARGAILALARLADRQSGQLLINELVLIAPDIDTAIFQQELSNIRQVANRITLYVSENDKALKLSHEVHGYPRLGQAGKDLSVIDGVDTIDISLMESNRLSGHLYHLYSPQIIKELKQLLHTGEPPERRPSLKILYKEGLPFWQMVPGKG